MGKGLSPSEEREHRHKTKAEDKKIVNAFRLTLVDNTPNGNILRLTLREQYPRLVNVFNQIERGL